MAITSFFPNLRNGEIAPKNYFQIRIFWEGGGEGKWSKKSLSKMSFSTIFCLHKYFVSYPHGMAYKTYRI